ncbi:hypothetical protein LCGC14_0897490 [marine sediment metagenome]|uniref:Uncharacterized protein n=1 Tax=marine sediment metagenome TaxID=412755 RepID=A0A0F9S491_9ZZZZ
MKRDYKTSERWTTATINVYKARAQELIATGYRSATADRQAFAEVKSGIWRQRIRVENHALMVLRRGAQA